MDERTLESALMNVLTELTTESVCDGDPEQAIIDLSDEIPGLDRLGTFEDRGVLTRDRGLVIGFEDGSEFQLTIVQSKNPTTPTPADEDDEND